MTSEKGLFLHIPFPKPLFPAEATQPKMKATDPAETSERWCVPFSRKEHFVTLPRTAKPPGLLSVNSSLLVSFKTEGRLSCRERPFPFKAPLSGDWCRLERPAFHQTSFLSL